MAINSKRKGKVGENEFAELARKAGFTDARRGVQYCGADGSADVIAIPGLHCEVKRCETTRIHDWMRQAVEDSAGTGNIPCVFHRRSREGWLATLNAEDYLRIYRVVQEALKGEKNT